MIDEFDMQLGKRLREVRLNRKLTMREISAVLGLQTSHYSQIEYGNRRIKLETLLVFCEYTGVPIEKMLSFENIKEIPEEPKYLQGLNKKLMYEIMMLDEKEKELLLRQLKKKRIAAKMEQETHKR